MKFYAYVNGISQQYDKYNDIIKNQILRRTAKEAFIKDSHIFDDDDDDTQYLASMLVYKKDMSEDTAEEIAKQLLVLPKKYKYELYWYLSDCQEEDIVEVEVDIEPKSD